MSSDERSEQPPPARYPPTQGTTRFAPSNGSPQTFSHPQGPVAGYVAPGPNDYQVYALPGAMHTMLQSDVFADAHVGVNVPAGSAHANLRRQMFPGLKLRAPNQMDQPMALQMMRRPVLQQSSIPNPMPGYQRAPTMVQTWPAMGFLPAMPYGLQTMNAQAFAQPQMYAASMAAAAGGQHPWMNASSGPQQLEFGANAGIIPPPNHLLRPDLIASAFNVHNSLGTEDLSSKFEHKLEKNVEMIGSPFRGAATLKASFASTEPGEARKPKIKRRRRQRRHEEDEFSSDEEEDEKSSFTSMDSDENASGKSESSQPLRKSSHSRRFPRGSALEKARVEAKSQIIEESSTMPPAEEGHGEYNGEQRLMIDFASLGEITDPPERLGKKGLIPDKLYGSFMMYSERWFFRIEFLPLDHPANQSESTVSPEFFPCRCIKWGIRNESWTDFHYLTETKEDALRRNHRGVSLCNKVFTEAMARRAAEFEEQLKAEKSKPQVDDVQVAFLEGRISVFRPKRFSEGPLLFGLRHKIVQRRSPQSTPNGPSSLDVPIVSDAASQASPKAPPPSDEVTATAAESEKSATGISEPKPSAEAEGL